jgi:hypothetical protein
MKFRIITLIFLSCALAAVTVTVPLFAQDQEEHSCESQKAVFTTFNPPGGEVAPFSLRINPAGAITGFYITGSYPNLASHGFLREPSGKITTFDAPGANTSAFPFGTVADAINPEGAITGYYNDTNSVIHGFLRARDGRISTFDVLGVGRGAGQGTYPTSINREGAITGYYFDPSNVYHGFCGAATEGIMIFDAPGAGTGPPAQWRDSLRAPVPQASTGRGQSQDPTPTRTL